MCIVIIFLCIHVTGCGLLAIDPVHSVLTVTPRINIYANLSMLCNFSYSVTQVFTMVAIFSLCISFTSDQITISAQMKRFVTFFDNCRFDTFYHCTKPCRFNINALKLFSHEIWLTCSFKWIVPNVLSALSLPQFKGSWYFCRWLLHDNKYNSLAYYPKGLR